MSLYASETVQLLQQETSDFISPDLCLPNSPVDYETDAGTCVHYTRHLSTPAT